MECHKDAALIDSSTFAKEGSESTTIRLPEIAISWIVKNCSSNQELASFSNVCRLWRLVVVFEIQKLSHVIDPHQVLKENGDLIGAVNSADQGYIHHGRGAVKTDCHPQSSLPCKYYNNEHNKRPASKIAHSNDEGLTSTQDALGSKYSITGGATPSLKGSKPTSSMQAGSLPPLSRLLLPSMAREQWRRTYLSGSSDNKMENTNVAIQKGPREDNLDQTFCLETRSNLVHSDTEAKNETFCLSWFHPEGIELFPVESSSAAVYSQDLIIDHDIHGNCIDAGGYIMPQQSDFNAKLLGKHLLALEWKSYVEAKDILKPFGYASAFIESVLGGNETRDHNETAIVAKAADAPCSTGNSLSTEKMANKTSHCNPLDQSSLPPSPNSTLRHTAGARNPYYSCDMTNTVSSMTTVAVRGAIVARPQPHETLRRRRRRRRRRGQSEVLVGQNAEVRRVLPRLPNDVWIQNNQRQLGMLQKLRLEELYEILPKVVNERVQHPSPLSTICRTGSVNDSSRVSSCLSKRISDKDNSNQRCHRNENGEADKNKEAGQKKSSAGCFSGVVNRPPWMAIEFLNSFRTRAVCLKTPAFACGMVAQPLTIFLIGVATEDGVFLSGLNQRLELGHMYRPNANSIDDGVHTGINSLQHQDFVIANKSSACIATDATAAETFTTPLPPYEGAATRRPKAEGQTSLDNIQDFRVSASSRTKVQLEREGTSGRSTNASRTSRDNESVGMIGFFSDSDDSSKEDARSRHSGDSSSECLSSSSSSSSLSDVMQDNEVLRGRTGPGRWHCYTAIFDGDQSELRVDGLKENFNSLDSHVGFFSPKGVLDGLTLGADHKFHLSLCCGTGGDTPAVSGGVGDRGADDDGDGEGEGAIAEVAVFKGRLPAEDVRAMETHLMTKHGIPSKCHEDWKVDDIRRQVSYLMSRPPARTATISVKTAESGVPLRYMAQHPSVSWYKEHPITGAKVSIKRIGCRTGDNSSDW